MLGASHGPEKDISRFYCDSTPFALCDNPPPHPPINFIFFVLFPPAYVPPPLIKANIACLPW